MKTGKTFFSISLWAAFALTIHASCADAATVRLTYHFDNPKLETLAAGFSRVIFTATMQAGRPGEPSYPFRGLQVLLPPGEAVSRVSVTRSGWRLLGGSLKLYPSQEPVPGIEIGREKPQFLYHAPAYEVDAWVYPPEAQFTTHYLRGHAIASGAMSPVGYHPSSGEVGYYGTVDIVLETSSSAEAREALKLLRTDPETTERVSKLVDNPSTISEYRRGAAPLRDPDRTFEYLIITNDSCSDAFLPLVDFYTRLGTRASIMTVEAIATSYSGIDLAEQVRNAIKDKYVNNGISHVLLGGDWDGGLQGTKIVPYRGLFCQVRSMGIITDDNIPADLYFAALDGNWNADGDTLWGEPGEDDPYSEIAVGRAPVDSPADVATFIHKVTMYQESPVASQTRRALLLGEKLYDHPLTYGDDELEQLVGTCSAYGYTTTGFPPYFTIVRKYARTQTWDAYSVFTEVNAGTNWLVHAGHSDNAGVMHILRTAVTDVNFTNDGVSAGFPIMNSTGCYAASFDNGEPYGMWDIDCIAEQMLKINHCAVAFLGNSRYGWFNEGTSDGPSTHLQREFYDAMFTEGYTTLGAATERSKDQTVPFLDLPGEFEPGATRWCFYTLNLLGDPALDGWTDMPSGLAVYHPEAVDRGSMVFTIGTGVPGSTACLYRAGVWYGRGSAGASGVINLVMARAIPDSVTWLELNIRAHNYRVWRDTIPVSAPASAEGFAPAASLEQNFPNPFNPRTVIRFSLARDSAIDLRVYDAAGREVARLAKGRASKGPHAITWAPSNVASGVYFYTLKTPGVVITRKAILIR